MIIGYISHFGSLSPEYEHKTKPKTTTRKRQQKTHPLVLMEDFFPRVMSLPPVVNALALVAKEAEDMIF